MKTTIVLLLVSVFGVSMQCYAQSADTVHTDTVHKNKYIYPMRDYIGLKLSVSDDIEGFYVNSTGDDYEILPNDKTVIRFSFNYRYISVAVKTSPKFMNGNDDDDLRGKTKYGGLSANLNFDHWMQKLSYTKSKGYYLNNTTDYINGWVEGSDAYIQFPELVYKAYSGSTSYKFNKNFSFNALSSQTERQVKSAGTFMPVLYYSYYIVDNQEELTAQSSSQKTNNFEAILSASYFYTFVFGKHFYASGGAGAGAGFISTKLITRTATADHTTKYTNPIYRFEAGLAIGYNADRFFAGAQLQASTAAYDIKNSSNIIETNGANYQLFIGYRFRAPKFLRDMTDKVSDESRGILK